MNTQHESIQGEQHDETWAIKEPPRTPGQAEGSVEDINEELRARGLLVEVEAQVEESPPVTWTKLILEPWRTPGSAEGQGTEEHEDIANREPPPAPAGRNEAEAARPDENETVGKIPDPNNVDG